MASKALTLSVQMGTTAGCVMFMLSPEHDSSTDDHITHEASPQWKTPNTRSDM